MKTRVKNFGIQNLKKFEIRNPTFGIRNPRLAWIPLHGAIDGIIKREFQLFQLNRFLNLKPPSMEMKTRKWKLMKFGCK